MVPLIRWNCRWHYQLRLRSLHKNNLSSKVCTKLLLKLSSVALATAETAFVRARVCVCVCVCWRGPVCTAVGDPLPTAMTVTELLVHQLVVTYSLKEGLKKVETFKVWCALLTELYRRTQIGNPLGITFSVMKQFFRVCCVIPGHYLIWSIHCNQYLILKCIQTTVIPTATTIIVDFECDYCIRRMDSRRLNLMYSYRLM